MPVTIDLYNLVVLKAAVEERYPDGMERFRSDLDFDPMRWADQEDAQLLRIGAMDHGPVMEQLKELCDRGLRYDPDEPENNDMVIIARYGGPAERPAWLRLNSVYAWHADSDRAVREQVERITRLSVEEFIRLRELGEIPTGSFG
ncbi:MAG: hypothetical protein JNM62_15505 [Flavobacteriales bacterium]|nr:hypothetical protein [Flavobacteriales bacterium]